MKAITWYTGDVNPSANPQMFILIKKKGKNKY